MTTENQTQDQWFIDEGMPGTGARPEWLQSKYKTMAEQAKAYPEAQKLASRGASGAPEQYDLSPLQEVIDAEDPTIQDFLSYAKTNHMTQEMALKSIEVAAKFKESLTVNEAKELERLGVDGEKMRERVEQWASNSMSAQGREAFSKIPKTAEFIQTMDEVRQAQARLRSATPGSVDHIVSMAPLTEAQIRQEMQENSQKYLTNPMYRQEIQNKLKQVLGET